MGYPPRECFPNPSLIDPPVWIGPRGWGPEGWWQFNSDAFLERFWRVLSSQIEQNSTQRVLKAMGPCQKVGPFRPMSWPGPKIAMKGGCFGGGGLLVSVGQIRLFSCHVARTPDSRLDSRCLWPFWALLALFNFQHPLLAWCAWFQFPWQGDTLGQWGCRINKKSETFL